MRLTRVCTLLLQVKLSPPTVFVNKVVLKGSHTHSFTYFPGFSSTKKAELGSGDRDLTETVQLI